MGHLLTITETRPSWKDSKKRRYFRCESWNTLTCLTWMVTVTTGQDKQKRNHDIPAIAPRIPVIVKSHVLGETRQGNCKETRRTPEGLWGDHEAYP